MTDIPNQNLNDIIASNGWRQGAIIPQELKNNSLGENDFAFVITQSCDLLHHNFLNEPIVEFLVARYMGDNNKIEVPFANGRNPRKFQFQFQLPGQATKCYCVEIKDKYSKQRDLLTNYKPIAFLTKDLNNSFSQWMGARYNRTALPDTFNNRLRLIKKKGLENLIREILKKPISQDIQDMYLNFIDFDIYNDEELEDDESYNIELYVLIYPNNNKNEIAKTFGKLESFFTEDTKINIDFVIKSTDDMTLTETKDLVRWSVFDDLS